MDAPLASRQRSSLAHGCRVNAPSKSDRTPLTWVMLWTSQHDKQSMPENETKARRTPAGACPKLQRYMTDTWSHGHRGDHVVYKLATHARSSDGSRRDGCSRVVRKAAD